MLVSVAGVAFGSVDVDFTLCGRCGNSEPEAVTRRVEKFAVAKHCAVSLRFHAGMDWLTCSSIASSMSKLILS